MGEEIEKRAGRRHYDPTISEAIDNHDGDEFAHGEALKPYNKRLTTLERWNERTVGAVSMLSFICVVFGAIVAAKIGLF